MSTSSLFAPRPGRAYYCVVGNPIEHSLSPLIHKAFAEATDQTLDYERVLVPQNGFDAALRAFVAAGGRGMNVTVPFKGDACSAVNHLSPAARAAWAVNTIVVEDDGSTRGENTDGVGLVYDLLHNQHIALTGANVLLVGAGGAARGVVLPLLAQGLQSLRVINRTEDRAQDLVATFGDARLSAGPLDDEPEEPVDLVINATSSGLGGERPPIDGRWFGPRTVAYDMVYGAGSEPFLHWASQRGAVQCADGLGMLVEQAAEAFQLWRGVRPATGPVMTMLRERSGVR